MMLLIKGCGQDGATQAQLERFTKYALEFVARMKVQPGIVAAGFGHQRQHWRAISTLSGFNVNNIERIEGGFQLRALRQQN